MKVTKENVADGSMLRPLVKEAPAQVSKVLADGAYDSKANFRFLDDIWGGTCHHQGEEERLCPSCTRVHATKDGCGRAAG